MLFTLTMMSPARRADTPAGPAVEMEVISISRRSLILIPNPHDCELPLIKVSCRMDPLSSLSSLSSLSCLVWLLHGNEVTV